MSIKRIGILHPGQMGTYIAANLRKGGNEVYWASENRSNKSRKRAEDYHLIELKTLAELCESCSLIFSVCPPAKAVEVAEKVISCNYKGLYVDANAINPQKSIEIGKRLTATGITYIDGGIIGNPAWEKGATSLYLSGEKAQLAAECFPDSRLEVHILGKEIGKASATKMCFASYTKGSTALLCNILALAEENGVREALEYEWSRDGSSFADNSKLRATGVTAKAWRFAGEMEEIAATFRDASLPDGFHKAAAEVYQRLAHFKDREQFPQLMEVLNSLLNRSGD